MDRLALAEYACKEIEQTSRLQAHSEAKAAKGAGLHITDFFPALGTGLANWVKVKPVTVQLPFVPGLYMDVQPFLDEAAFTKEIGIGLEPFLELMRKRKGLVRPYINSMLSRYEGLDWLDPFLEKAPPTFIRHTGFFNAAGGGRYYEDFMSSLQHFRGHLGDLQTRNDWEAKFHRPGRTFETKVAFDYARLRALRPDLADGILDMPSLAAQANLILLRDAQVVDPYTNAFEGFYRFDPKYLQGHGSSAGPAQFDLGIGSTILEAFDLRFPQNLDVDGIVDITRDGAWRKGARLCETIHSELERRRQDDLHDRAMDLTRLWEEVAEALRANSKRTEEVAMGVARVSLGIAGSAVTLATGEWGAIEGAQASAPALAGRLRPALGRLGMLGKPDFIAAAWDYDMATRRTLGRPA